MLPVVNEFRVLNVFGALQSGDLRICIVKKESELGYITKQISLKFMQLDKRDEAAVAGLIKPCPFESSHALIRVMAQFFSFFNAGEFRMEGVKVNHRGKKHVIPRLLLEKAVDVVLHRPEISPTSAMNSALFSGVCNQNRVVHIDPKICQMRFQDRIGKRLFR